MGRGVRERLATFPTPLRISIIRHAGVEPLIRCATVEQDVTIEVAADQGGEMRKYLWAIIAGGCMLALIVVGAIFVPPLLNGSPPTEVPEGYVILKPGHWWKMEITEQQRSSLATLWGRDVSIADLLRDLWPDVLPQLPQEVVSAYEKGRISWSVDTYEVWKGEMLCSCRGLLSETGPTMGCLYIGSHESEESTFETRADRGLIEDRVYRISIYTSDRSP
jgi:hypothetical protein